MGSWKDWSIGMIESGYSDREITAAESRIKGTLADPLVRRLTAQEPEDGHPDQDDQ